VQDAKAAQKPRVGRWYQVGDDWLEVVVVGERYATLVKRGRGGRSWRRHWLHADLAKLPSADQRPLPEA
jgi:hypothetical protein